MLAIGPAVSSTAFLRTFDYRGDSTLANRGLYYIHSAVLAFRHRLLRKRLDERAVYQRVVHDGYIVERIIVLGVHIVYHIFGVILKVKAVAGATRPVVCPYRLAIFVLSLTTLITVILQVHRLLSRFFAGYLFYLYRGQTVILNL